MTRCAVVQLVRDNEKYFLNRFPAVFKAVNQGVADLFLSKPLWFFIENDSRDQTILLAQQYGHVLTVPVPRTTILTSRCTMRTEKMAYLRNEAMQWIARFGVFDYIIWLDTDVTFSANTIKQLLKCLENDELIGMACANTLQRGAGMHYYDTYALASDNCLWMECTLCRGSYSAKEPVDVHSAFGGLCVVRGALKCFFAATHNQCEHVYMCTGIRDQGFRVVILGAARAEWSPQ